MGTIVTRAGLADIATATFMHEQCNWTKMAVGDGGGSQYVPTDTQTELRGQKWIGNIDNYTSTSETQGVFQTHIPTDVGGFVIREIGIFNEDEELVAIGTVADQTKTALSSGDDHYSDMLIDFHIAVDHADSIKVQVNPNITVATTEYVLGQLENYVQKEQGKSLVEDEKIAQIDTNQSDIEELQAFKTTVESDYVKKQSLDTDLKDYAKQEWVQSQIEAIDVTDQLTEYAKTSEVERDYVKKSNLETDLADYAKTADVTNDFVKKDRLETDLADYAKTSDITEQFVKKDRLDSDLSEYAKSSDVESDYVKKDRLETDLKDYATKTDLSSIQESVQSLTTQLQSIQTELTGVSEILSNVNERLGAVN